MHYSDLSPLLGMIKYNNAPLADNCPQRYKLFVERKINVINVMPLCIYWLEVTIFMKLRYLVFCIALSPIHTIHAASDQVPTDRTISSIHAYDSFVFINFTPSFTSSQGCTHADSDRRVTIDTSGELGKNIYSAALSAAAAQKKVGFGLAGCHTERPKVYRIDVNF